MLLSINSSVTTDYNIPAGTLHETTEFVIIQGTITTASTGGTFKLQCSWTAQISLQQLSTQESYCKSIKMQ